MDNLEHSIKELNNNIVMLNRNILALLAGNGNVGGVSSFSIELLKDALLNEEVQELLTEIVNYNQYNRKPLVKEDRKPLENTQVKEVTQQEVITTQQQKPVQQETIQQEIVQQETNKQTEEKQNQFTNSVIVETLYTVKSPKKGYFTATNKVNDIFRTQYQIDVYGDEGEFFIPESVDALRFLLSPEKFLAPACEGDYDFNGTKDKLIKIETIQKGLVKKDVNGWKIIKKAVIKVIKE